MFGFMKNKVTSMIGDAAKRFDGRTDVLEGVCASLVRLMIADGEIEDSEVLKSLDLMIKHPVIGASFSPTQIEATLMKMASLAKEGFSGKLALSKEVDEMIGKTSVEDREPIGMLLLDVAHSDGELEPAEMTVLNDLFGKLGLKSPKSYLNAA